MLLLLLRAVVSPGFRKAPPAAAYAMKAGDAAEDGINEERLMRELLASAGVRNAEPAVSSQLVECLHRFCEEVLKDGHDFAVHAARKTTEIEDLKLALQVREEGSIVPTRDSLFDLAREVNSVPFPPIVGASGLRLPPAEFQVTNRPFRVVPKKASQPRGAARSSPDQGVVPASSTDSERPVKKARMAPGKPGGKQITVLLKNQAAYQQHGSGAGAGGSS